MPKTSISKSMDIEASPEVLFEKISVFRQWPAWSPWLILEPDADLTFSEDGRSYAWEGKRIGAGTISKTHEVAGQQLDCQLEIVRPWKSTSTVFFRLEPTGEGTRITWLMQGRLPWFLFWMKPMMETVVGMDYVRGLTMLKDLCETGEVPSAIQVVGREDFSGRTYIGISTECKIPEIGEKMGADFQTLEPLVNEQGIDESNPPFTVYEKWNMNTSGVRYTVGIPVEVLPAEIPAGLVAGELPAGPVYVIQHTGPYRHLGNAWSLGMMLSRNKTFRTRRGAYPFEVYVNDPRKTEEKDLVVHICFPMM